MENKPAWYYRQSAAIPYQWHEGVLNILLITSRKHKKWGIPKGVVEPDMSPAESAAQEALEEAGIIGEITGEIVGIYEYPKWGGICRVEVFPLRIKEIHTHWEESYFRERRLLPIKEAEGLIENSDLRQIIVNFKNIPKDSF